MKCIVSSHHTHTLQAFCWCVVWLLLRFLFSPAKLATTTNSVLESNIDFFSYTVMTQPLLKLLLCVSVAACFLSVCVAVKEESISAQANGVLLFDLGRTDSVVSDARHMRRYLTEEGPDAPLYRGFGTHFVYVYVGTPRQRVSVIVDTGSHHTAFPCTGCNQCGDHTDLYFNPKQSSTIEIPKCGGKNCVFSQSYTEGSMWTAYRVSLLVPCSCSLSLARALHPMCVSMFVVLIERFELVAIECKPGGLILIPNPLLHYVHSITLQCIIFHCR